MLVTTQHTSVLLEEAMELLNVRPGGVYVDGTVGAGGHAEAIVRRLSGGRLIALDRDREALDLARQRLSDTSSDASFHPENFKNLPLVLRHLGVEQLDGCLIDLGVSSMQLESPERGFSFRLEGPLDMRMNRESQTTAADLVNTLPPDRLADILRDYGEERQARRIAGAIVQRRQERKFQTTTDLAKLVEEVKKGPPSRIHKATQTFQALRIAVNRELEGLDEFLNTALEYLAPGGRLVVISFHSLEDRIVKQTFKLAAGKCICFRPAHLCTCPRRQIARILTPRPVTPSPREIQANPRSRSARLRAVEKISPDNQGDS